MRATSTASLLRDGELERSFRGSLRQGGCARGRTPRATRKAAPGAPRAAEQLRDHHRAGRSTHREASWAVTLPLATWLAMERWTRDSLQKPASQTWRAAASERKAWRPCSPSRLPEVAGVGLPAMSAAVPCRCDRTAPPDDASTQAGRSRSGRASRVRTGRDARLEVDPDPAARSVLTVLQEEVREGDRVPEARLPEHPVEAGLREPGVKHREQLVAQFVDLVAAAPRQWVVQSRRTAGLQRVSRVKVCSEASQPCPRASATAVMRPSVQTGTRRARMRRRRNARAPRAHSTRRDWPTRGRRTESAHEGRRVEDLAGDRTHRARVQVDARGKACPSRCGAAEVWSVDGMRVRSVCTVAAPFRQGPALTWKGRAGRLHEVEDSRRVLVLSWLIPLGTHPSALAQGWTPPASGPRARSTSLRRGRANLGPPERSSGPRTPRQRGPREWRAAAGGGWLGRAPELRRGGLDLHGGAGVDPVRGRSRDGWRGSAAMCSRCGFAARWRRRPASVWRSRHSACRGVPWAACSRPRCTQSSP